MRTIQGEISKGVIKPETLLLGESGPEIKTVGEEVEVIKSKLDDFGINNKTSKYIKEKKKEYQKVNEQLGSDTLRNQILDVFIKMMYPFKIVSYKTIHEVALDHNLVISSLSFYNEAIDDENLEELQIFKDLLCENHEDISSKIKFPNGNSFTFDVDNVKKLKHVDFSNYFNIVAPKSHFDFGDTNIKRIGQEIKSYEKKPGFSYEFKYYVPEPKDPVIIAPFRFLGELYCFIVTAWDEVADDTRIRQLIK